MTVIALSIEPDSCDISFPSFLANALHLQLVDLRNFESQMAERLDCGPDRDCTERPALKRDLSPKRWPITRSQLSARFTETVLRTVADDNALIVGWIAPVIAGPIDHVMRVRIGAPLPARTERTMKRLAYRDARTAQLELASFDSLIARSVLHTTGACWNDDSHFDLVLNAARLPREACARAIAELAACGPYRTTMEQLMKLEAKLDVLAASDIPNTPIVAPREAQTRRTPVSSGPAR